MKTAVFTSDNSNSTDSKLLLSRISDAVDLSKIRQKNCYVGFLNEAEIYTAENFLHNSDIEYCFWGGYENAQRKLFCALSGAFNSGEVPVSAVELTYRKADSLSHRDFLGTLMSFGIERSAVGDILISPGRAVVFLKSDIKDYICSQITKVGGAGVKIKDSDLSNLPPVSELSEKNITVPSLRIDAVIAALIGYSREKTQRLVSRGDVLVNYSQCLNTSKKLSKDDVVTVRKHGKFIINNVIGETKKGRLKLSVQLFR